MKKNIFPSKFHFYPTIPLLFLTLGGFVLDQTSKLWVAQNLDNPLLLTSWARIVYEKNIGIAFSIQLPYVFLITANILLLGLIIYFLATRLNWKHGLSILIFSLFTAGALGNLADRLHLGYVVDFISVGSFPVFNLADSFITVSVFLLLLFYDKIKRPN
jgi:signal peptidase II